MKNSQHKISKFIILLSIHVLFIIFVYTITMNILLNYYPLKELSYFIVFFTNSLFCLIFFVLMWKDLYNHNYHYFIKYNRKMVVLKNIIYTILFILSGIVFIYMFDSFLYLNRILDNYLTEIFIFLIIDSCCFILLHVIQYGWICYMIKKRYLQQNVLIIGEPDKRFPILSFFQTKINSKLYVGKLFIKGSHWYYQDTDNKQKVISNSDIPEILFKLQVGEMIIFINKKLSKKYIYELVKYCRQNSIGYYLVPDVNKLPKIHFWAKSFPYIPVIEKYTTNRDSLTLISCKKIIDIILVSLSSIILFPLCLVIALMIKIEDGGPIFYVSKRVGKDSNIIKFYKFRSMNINADKLKNNLLKYNERIDGPLFKIHDDPRVTKVGKILRKYSMDELPQLLNVLKGDMSIVGPRPHLISEVNEYSYKDILRLECIPGITCFPQINGRNTISFRKWVDLDLLYRKKWSLLLDLKIIAETLKVVIKSSV